MPTIFGDINGDGVVNVVDYNDVRTEVGTSLPSVSDALIAVGPGSQGGPALVRIGTSGPSLRTAASRAHPRAEIQLSGRGWSRANVDPRQDDQPAVDQEIDLSGCNRVLTLFHGDSRQHH